MSLFKTSLMRLTPHVSQSFLTKWLFCEWSKIKNLYQYMQRWVYSKLLWWGQPPNISKNLLSNLFRNLTKIILMLVEDLDHISRKTKHFFLKLNKYLTWIALGLGYYSTMSTFNISSSRLNRDYSFL